MRPYSLSHMSDHDLLRGLASLVAQDRTTTAGLLAHVAEVDTRGLYLPAAYPSMFAYCVHELHLSEDSAYRRITAARVARQFPVVFEAVAEGRLSLTAVGLLSAYLRPENADELLEAAAHKTKCEIEELLAQRFPRSEMLPLVVPASSCQLVPPMKTGCQRSTWIRVFAAEPSLTSRLFGVRTAAPGFAAKSGVPHGATGFAPKERSRDHPLRVSVGCR